MRIGTILAVFVLALSMVAVAQTGGVQADGWEARLDRDGDATAVLSFTSMGEGVHAQTSGPGAAIFWEPSSVSEGDYTISAAFTQTEPSGHPNAYGLFFGGSDLSGPDQQYSYFVIRQDGQFLIKQRMGNDTPDVVSWTEHDAINQLNADGSSENVLSVEVGSSDVVFLVNGTEVATLPRSAVDTDGIAGLRVTHLLDVHIDDLQLRG